MASKAKIKQISGTGGSPYGILQTDGENLYFSSTSTGGAKIPAGTTAERPSLTVSDNGVTRFNTNLGLIETWTGTSWVSGGSGINNLSDVSGGEPALTENNPAITDWVLTTLKSDAIVQLNQVLGKLVPSQPSDFPGGQTLTIANVGNLPLLASGAVPDNTNGGTLPSLPGQSVTRITNSLFSTNTIGDNGSTGFVGPGNIGTVAALVNNSTVGNIILTNGSQNGTYGNLVISNDTPFPSTTPGFWESFRSTISNASALQGWNRARITHSAANNTNEVYFVRDNLTSNPTLSGGSVANQLASTSFSSGVAHYGNSASDAVTITGLQVTNLSGETYYGGSDPFTVTGIAALNAVTGKGFNHTGSIGSATNFTYSTAGITTPIIRQTTSATSLSGITYILNSNNNHTMGYLTVVARNVNGTSSTLTLSNPYILVKRGTAQANQVDENSIVGSSVNGFRTYLGASFTGDVPSGPLPSTAPSWVSNQDLSQSGYLHEAACVGGAITRDITNYTIGYLPANTVNYSSKNASQYFTFVFTKAALSNFSLNITGSYSGLWIGLPNISDNNSLSPNALGGAWWNAFELYNGSGIPGRIGDLNAGCANGSVASGTSGTVNITFGAATSSDSTNNRIIVRLKLNAGNYITGLSMTN